MKVKRDKKTFRIVRVTFTPDETDQVVDKFAHCEWIEVKPRPDLKPWGTREVLMYETVNNQ